MIKSTFFCESCRKIVNDISQLYFVEENSDRGFCSEECIKDFYRPIMKFLEQEETVFRKELNLEDEEHLLHLFGKEKLLENAISNPDEKWLLVNDVDQKFITHFYKFSHEGIQTFLILICTYIEDEPSFVYYRTITQEKDLIAKYQREFLLEVEEENKLTSQESEIPTEFFEMLETKKSSLLAEHLVLRKESDITFEEFYHYEKFLESTMKSPDEVYQIEDDEGDDLYVYIKSFLELDKTFFYIVLAYKYKSKKDSVFVPALGFPSNDKELYPHYAKGISLKDQIKN